MHYFAKRKWFFTSIILATSSICIRVTASIFFAKGAAAFASKVQELVDSKASEIPGDTFFEANTYERYADYLCSGSFWILVTGAVLLVVSIMAGEPIRHGYALPFFITAFVVQIVFA